jgi:hypothetical protein
MAIQSLVTEKIQVRYIKLFFVFVFVFSLSSISSLSHEKPAIQETRTPSYNKPERERQTNNADKAAFGKGYCPIW